MFFPPSLNKKRYSRKNNEQDEMRQKMPEKKTKILNLTLELPFCNEFYAFIAPTKTTAKTKKAQNDTAGLTVFLALS